MHGRVTTCDVVQRESLKAVSLPTAQGESVDHIFIDCEVAASLQGYSSGLVNCFNED